LGAGECLAEAPSVEELLVACDDLFVVGEVVACAAVLPVGVGDLVDHQRVVVGSGAAFHLAVLGEDILVGGFVGVLGGGLVELVVPLVAGALVIVPPGSPGFFVGA